jgi:hypothetical protein
MNIENGPFGQSRSMNTIICEYYYKKEEWVNKGGANAF